MTFRDAHALFLLLLVPVVAAFFVAAFRARQAASARVAETDLLRRLVVGRPGRPRAVRAVLAVLGLALLVVAFAGPEYGSRERLVRKRGIDVVVVLDFSKSMLARDVRPSRIERAKSEVRRLLEELGGDRVGIVAFAGETMEFPLTTDYGAIELFLRDLGPYDMPVGGTAIGRALTAASRLLERARAARPKTPDDPGPEQLVILVTDGEDHEGDPVEAARQLATSGVRVHVLGVGSETGAPIPTFAPDGTWTGYLRDERNVPVMTALTTDNERQLKEIAKVSNGRYWKAEEGSLSMAPIRATLRSMRAAEREARSVRIAEDRFALVLLPAFLLLLLEALLPEGMLGLRRGLRPVRVKEPT